MSKFIVIDTETGGLDKDTHSLLSVGIVVYENGVETLAETIYHKQSEYCVTPKAMEINRLSLSQVQNDGFNTEGLRREIYNIITHDVETNSSSEEPIFLGHNIQFDAHFLGKIDKNLVHHIMRNHIDTKALALHLFSKGKIPERRTGLADLCEYFGIPTDSHHDALVDARMTYQLYLALREL